MGKVQYTNNAVAHTTMALNAGDTRIQVDDASLFPDLAADEFTFITLGSNDTTSAMEVVRIGAVNKTSNTLTVNNGGNADFDIDLPYPANTTVELRMCTELLNALGDMGVY